MPHADVRIGTRGSLLARWQARRVQRQLAERFAGRPFVLTTVTAAADQQPETPLSAMQGEGLFVKELEQALLAREIDIAVHSLKDVPLAAAAGLRIAAVLARDDARDALVAREAKGLSDLPKAARLGTSSLRRRGQALRQRPDLEMREIRGNVDTRLRKLSEGRYEAIIVAACGLVRLGLADRITERLPMEVMLPEPGQGAIAVEARADDEAVLELLRPLNDQTTQACTDAERALLAGLGGGCHLPIAAYAEIREGRIHLEAAVIAVDGSRQIRNRLIGPGNDPAGVGSRLADQLMKAGANDLLPHTRL